VGASGALPSNFEIRDETRNEDDVEWAVPDNLESDPDVAAPRITSFRVHTAAPQPQPLCAHAQFFEKTS
jgi:hypothetical protein